MITPAVEAPRGLRHLENKLNVVVQRLFFILGSNYLEFICLVVYSMVRLPNIIVKKSKFLQR